MDEPQIFFFFFYWPLVRSLLTETSYVNQNSLVLWDDAFRRGGPFSKAKMPTMDRGNYQRRDGGHDMPAACLPDTFMSCLI